MHTMPMVHPTTTIINKMRMLWCRMGMLWWVLALFSHIGWRSYGQQFEKECLICAPGQISHLQRTMVHLGRFHIFSVGGWHLGRFHIFSVRGCTWADFTSSAYDGALGQISHLQRGRVHLGRFHIFSVGGCTWADFTSSAYEGAPGQISHLQRGRVHLGRFHIWNIFTTFYSLELCVSSLTSSGLTFRDASPLKRSMQFTSLNHNKLHHISSLYITPH